jgi:flavin-dependent dehydrogenase
VRSHDFDIVVVGAGPAGLATALYAARSGLHTMVMDSRSGPIDKACGEGLMPGAVAALRELNVALDGHPIRGIRYTDGRKSVDASFRHGPGAGVRRIILQSAMIDAARAAGVHVTISRADHVTVETDGVSVNGQTARYLVAADGLHSPLRRRLGLARNSRGDTRSRRPQARWGTRQHYAMAPWTDLVEVHWARHSEAYVTPVGQDLVGIAVLSSVQAPFREQLAAFPMLCERLPDIAATSVRGAGPLRQRTSARTAGRALLVGDAAGYVDALTGEGIAVSLRCAQALVHCVLADDPQSYERAWRAASRRYRTLTGGLLWARQHKVIAPLIVPAAAACPPVFSAVVAQLAD